MDEPNNFMDEPNITAPLKVIPKHYLKLKLPASAYTKYKKRLTALRLSHFPASLQEKRKLSEQEKKKQ